MGFFLLFSFSNIKCYLCNISHVSFFPRILISNIPFYLLEKQNIAFMTLKTLNQSETSGDSGGRVKPVSAVSCSLFEAGQDR